MRPVLLIILIVFLSACESELCRDSVSPVQVDLEVERLEEELFKSQSTKEVEDFLEAHEDFATFFLDADQYPSLEVLASQIYTLLQNPSIDTLYQEAKTAFEKFDQIETELESSMGRLKAYYPETKTPKIQTVVTGLYKDMFITNEHIMIGLDFFIGEDASYKPQEIPNYILRRYSPEHLSAAIMQFISSQYIKPGQGDAMLVEMIDYGKSFYLLSKIMPCTNELILIGYTDEEWNDVFENEEIIWANFVQNELLYETNHSIKQKFLGERPNVYEIGDKCPGRIGRWLGWQIVKAYAEKTRISVEDLMKETDHNKIFTRSGYKPR